MIVNYSRFFSNLGFYLLLAFAHFCLSAKAPDLFLLKNYDAKTPVIGWVMSEKLDGVRAYWDGKQLLTRGGKVINTPEWFTKNYPPFAIDGELWTKRNDFENILSITSTKTPDKRWQQVKHYIFDVPSTDNSGLLTRLNKLEQYLVAIAVDTPIVILQQQTITKKAQVKRYLKKVTAKKGEGIVVRDPKTPYQTGRLKSALKVKNYEDTECTVIAYKKGKGKNVGKMGALLCQMASGQMVTIGTGFTDKQRETPPAIGSEITFKFYGLTKKGKPKYPVFLKVK